jgi:hypothetical protein
MERIMLDFIVIRNAIIATIQQTMAKYTVKQCTKTQQRLLLLNDSLSLHKVDECVSNIIHPHPGQQGSYG